MMRGFGYGYNTMGTGGVWWWELLMFLFWLLVIAGVVVLIVWVIRQLSRSQHGHNVPGAGYYAEPGRRDEACETARMRYARGEITREQYDEICHTLGVPGPPPPRMQPPVMQPPVAGTTPPPAAPTPPPAPTQAPPDQPPVGS